MSSEDPQPDLLCERAQKLRDIAAQLEDTIDVDARRVLKRAAARILSGMRLDTATVLEVPPRVRAQRERGL